MALAAAGSLVDRAVSERLSAISLSATVAGTLKGRAFFLCSQLRGLAARTMGMLVCGVTSLLLKAAVTLERHQSFQLGLPTRYDEAVATLEGCLLKQIGWVGQVCWRMSGWNSQGRWAVLELVGSYKSIWLSRLKKG